MKNPAENEEEYDEDKYKEIVSVIFENATEETEKELQNENNTIDEVKKKWDMNDKIIKAFIQNISQDQQMRSEYGEKLIKILSIELIFLIIIFLLKGLGILNYSDSSFNIFITGGIAEVFVLVKVIVQYLFKDNLTNALNIILENNNIKLNKNVSDKNKEEN